MKPPKILVVALVLLMMPNAWAIHPKAVQGRGGAVSCAAPAARDAGLQILEAGGNAADAAVAVALALAVVHPQAGNLGGGGFAVVRFGDEVETLDFREVAPAASTRDMYLDDDGKLDRQRSLIGPLAAGVPGSLAGLIELHRRFGTLEWHEVVEPARRLAADGFVVTERLHASLERSADLLGRFPETAAIWMPGGTIPEPGSTIRIPDLASTLEAYGEQGLASLEPVARAIAEVSKQLGGVMTAKDVVDYRPQWRQPIRFEAFGWQIASMPLPSSGGIILAESCGVLERLEWSRQPRFGAERTHLLVESWRRAFADRFSLGAPESTVAQARDLLDPGYLDQRSREISSTHATPSKIVEPWARTDEHLETTHLSVIDSDGHAVSMTTTLNGSFGCGVTVPGFGFLLNNEMDDFAALPGQPNQFGLVQGEANAVRPGLRMLSSMSPTIAWKEGEMLVLGSPGGSRIPTATLQVLLNVIVDGDHLQAAVDRPRVHHQWLPDKIFHEADALAPETRQRLESLGHHFGLVDHLGEVSAVRLQADGCYEAANDPRGPGGAGVLRAQSAELRDAKSRSSSDGSATPRVRGNHGID